MAAKRSAVRPGKKKQGMITAGPHTEIMEADAIHRIKKIHPILDQHYRVATTALDYQTPLQLLIATILSAQCTDERVNRVTPALFARYPTAADFAAASLQELEQAIHSTGFYRAKSKSIQGACQMLTQRYGGEVPSTMEELLELPGVARKTANVVLGTAFGIPSGIVVDTHVKRVAGRLGLTSQSDPNKIERDLMKIIPQERWITFGHQLILHGRQICQARKPRCSDCALASLCPSAHSFG
jgi:endonuclease-3